MTIWPTTSKKLDDAAQNALGICFKLLNPRNYAFGGLHYRFSYDFGEEVRKLAEIGFDGIKMIENKPSERKRLGFRQDDPRYDSLYRTVTALDLPMLIHVNDPAENWDWNRCSDWAKEQGYYYYLTKALDPYRPVVTNDGWEHTLCDTQLTDVQQEVNGLVDAERNPKLSPETEAFIAESNRSVGAEKEAIAL